jgi:hypothetical protein
VTPAQAAPIVRAAIVKRQIAGKRIIDNTAKLAASGSKDAARAMSLIVKRAAARREAGRWKLKSGRIQRVR